MSYLARSDADGDLIAARATFIELAGETDGLVMWADKEFEGRAEVEKIRVSLNDLELMAIGIEHEIVDFEIVFAYRKDTVFLFWENARPFVSVIRDRAGDETIYNALENLYLKMQERVGSGSESMTAAKPVSGFARLGARL